MADILALAASQTAILVEFAGAVIVAIGCAEALVRSVASLGTATLGIKKSIWVRLAMWLVLGLEFELAADIIRSAVTPTWAAIGQLAAIAAIRTFLNYFLQRDIDKMAEVGTTLIP